MDFHHHNDTNNITNNTDDEDEEEDQEQEELAKMASANLQEQVSGAGTIILRANSKPGKPFNRYRECLKNHAVGIGGNAVDGCCEFMPGGSDGTLDALKCAACGCHRNFHRKEVEGEGSGTITTTNNATAFHPSFGNHYQYHRGVTPAGYLNVAPHQHYRPPLALPSLSGGGGGHSRDDMEDDVSNPSGSGGHRKRFRTKFTSEQKDKMLVFAEKLGWRIQKQDEQAVQQFCAETNVRRHVLKVWMHNNKNTLGKKPVT